MKNRIVNICHGDFVTKNIRILYNLLRENAYPKVLVSKILYHERGEGGHVIENSNNLNNNHNNRVQRWEEMGFKFGSITSYDHLTDKIIKSLKNENLIIAKRNAVGVGSRFSRLKDRTPLMCNANVVYKLKCNVCNKVYVGQTSQLLKGRLALHKSDIRKGLTRCELSNHIINNIDHVIDFDNVQILAKEQNYTKRNFLEMTYINDYNNNLNKRSDVNNLSVIYTYILNRHLDNHEGPLDE